MISPASSVPQPTSQCPRYFKAPSPPGYLRGAAVHKAGRVSPTVPLEPLLRAECRASVQGASLRSLELGRENTACCSWRTPYTSQRLIIIYNLTPQCSSFQPAVSSHKVLISPRTCFLRTCLLLRSALTSLGPGREDCLLPWLKPSIPLL